MTNDQIPMGRSSMPVALNIGHWSLVIGHWSFSKGDLVFGHPSPERMDCADRATGGRLPAEAAKTFRARAARALRFAPPASGSVHRPVCPGARRTVTGGF